MNVIDYCCLLLLAIVARVRGDSRHAEPHTAYFAREAGQQSTVCRDLLLLLVGLDDVVGRASDDVPRELHIGLVGLRGVYAEADRILVVEHGRHHVDLARVVELEQ